jgi:adenylosuccinate lyase
MYVKDIGRETAEMLVERKRMINQERHKKLRLTQSRRVNRRQIVEHLGKEDGKEVQALAVNL